MPLELWTDGSSGKDGSGGWCFILVRDDSQLIKMSGYDVNTTNNRMELSSVIQGIEYALRFVKPSEKILVRSDSAYVVNCFIQKWYEKWFSNNWTTYDGKTVSNRDLWEMLLKMVLPNLARIEWQHVKGHNGVKWNEEADDAAHTARMKAVQILKNAQGGEAKCQATM